MLPSDYSSVKDSTGGWKKVMLQCPLETKRT